MVGPFPPTRGGVTTYMLNVMNSFLRERYEFIGFTTSRPPKKNVAQNWGYAATLKGGLLRTLSGIVVTLWHLLSFPVVVLLRRPALVQIHASDYFVFWESTCYVLMAKALRVPTLLRIGGAFNVFYGSSSPRAQRMIRAAVRLPDGLIVQSAYWREFVRRIGRDRTVFSIANAVDEDLLLQAPPARGGEPVFLFIAGPEAHRKGSRELTAAIQQLERNGVRARFRLLAVPKVVLAEMELAGVAPLVSVTGSMDRLEVIREMRQAHVFLLPSHSEGFPNSLLEAMASRMASIVTPVGAVPEIVGDGPGALVVPAGDPAALAEAIATLARDPQRCLAMGQYNEEVVMRRYTNGVVLPQLDAAYRRLIDGDAAGTTAPPPTTGQA
jgi:glycosyltransferase involved in cell wall biosynthesis